MLLPHENIILPNISLHLYSFTDPSAYSPRPPLYLVAIPIQIVLIDAKPSVRKQILRELQIMHDCNSQYIISFYGAFISDPNICICMEFMDKGSLDGIYKKIGPIDVDVVGKVALAVLEGLTYLYDVHRIIHRGTSISHLPLPRPRPHQRHSLTLVCACAIKFRNRY